MNISATNVGAYIKESELKYTAAPQLTHAECARMYDDTMTMHQLKFDNASQLQSNLCANSSLCLHHLCKTLSISTIVCINVFSVQTE